MPKRIRTLVACDICGKGYPPADLLECPNCLRMGCEECIPCGRNTLCKDCEDEQARDGEASDAND